MSNSAYIPDYGDDRELQINHEEYDFFEFNELMNKGVKNEHSDNVTRNIRNWKINQPTQHESSRNIADSSGEEAAPF